MKAQTPITWFESIDSTNSEARRQMGTVDIFDIGAPVRGQPDQCPRSGPVQHYHRFSSCRIGPPHEIRHRQPHKMAQ